MSSRSYPVDEAQILDRDAVVVLGAENANRRLWVQQGAVWLTATPATGDVVLVAGDDYWLEGGAPWVLQGLEDAVVIKMRG